MAILDFNVIPERDIETTSGEFPALPAGEYKACLIEIGDKDNPSRALTIAKNGKGEFLRTVWEIVYGEYKGRKLFENLQLKRYGKEEKDKRTMGIANGKLSKMCHAAGIHGGLKDTNQLLNKPPVLITLKVKAASGNYEASNEIVDWKEIVASNPAPTAPSDDTPAGVMPWEE